MREIDALGGEMGKNIDKTYIQSKMLNLSKGPAVHSLRAQADKQEYSREMRRVLENTGNLTIRQGEVSEILTENGRVSGVRTSSDAVFPCRAVILCTGTYLRADCIHGEYRQHSGPNGMAGGGPFLKKIEKLFFSSRPLFTRTPPQGGGGGRGFFPI